MLKMESTRILSSRLLRNTVQIRHYTNKKAGFFGQLLENIRNDLEKNKDMKENLKKFREETEKLDQSEAMKKARQKFENIEAETSRGSDAFQQQLSKLKDKISDTVDEVQKTEIAKKGKEFTDELSKTVGRAAETVSKSGQHISSSEAFKNISQGVRAVKDEIDDATAINAKLYRPPEQLRKRTELSSKTDRHVEANTDAQEVVMHKDSRWSESWASFKDNNIYVNKMFDLKTQYEESDNVVIRASRLMAEKLGYLFGGMFTKTEMSEVLTEICKMDPHFDKEQFLKDCRYDIIPNILEAMVRGNVDILKDWCYEASFNVLSQPILQAQKSGYIYDSRVLDVSNVDIVAGKMMEQGPMLVISFNSQQIMTVRDVKGTVIEGSPEKIMRIFYVWALCRDQEEYDPRAAWRLMDISANISEQWI